MFDGLLEDWVLFQYDSVFFIIEEVLTLVEETIFQLVVNFHLGQTQPSNYLLVLYAVKDINSGFF